MKRLSILLFSSLLVGGAFSVDSCVKKDFDNPPDESAYDPQLQVTHTIKQLLEFPKNTAITQDVIISGVVVMDDKSGNYYKKIVIDDGTAGIEVDIDANSLYNEMPIGRKIYIKCKGLVIGAYGQNPNLGYGISSTGSTEGIPSTLLDNFVVKANYPNPIQIDTFTLSELADPGNNLTLLNRLVAIKDVEFTADAVGVPYAAPSSTTNRDIEACNSSSKISVRSSNYAKFQPVLTPSGKGVIVGLYTRYNQYAQLYIRDTSDVQFNGLRCGENDPSIVKVFEQNFNTGVANAVINLSGWTNYSEAGNVKFKYAGSNGNFYANVTANGANVPSVKSWLVTPQISLNNVTNPKLELKTNYGFADNATLKAYITTNFNGDPTAATWTALPSITVAGQSNWVWKDITLDLSAYAGQNVYIAFKYEGGTAATATFQIDDILLSGGQ